MALYLFIKILQMFEAIGEGRLIYYLIHYLHNKIIPVEKKLSEIKYLDCKKICDGELKIIEANEIKDKKLHLSFCKKSMKYKTKYYLDKGYGGFLLIKENKVLGYIWYSDVNSKNNHPDITKLNIKMKMNSVYIFDLFICEFIRKNNFSGNFFNTILYKLKMLEYEIVYAYYSYDNLPSKWIHRSLGFLEYPIKYRKKFGRFN